MINLASCYENGKGCKLNTALAFEFYRKAALKGDPLGIIIYKNIFDFIFRYGECCSFV